MIYSRQEWYTPAEIAVHSTRKDCWVSLNGKVLDLTIWLEEQFNICKCQKSCSCNYKNWWCDDDCLESCDCYNRGYPYCDSRRLGMMILAYAGKDISHWFKDGDWVKYYHPITGQLATFRVHGHGMWEALVPSTRWRPLARPWWLDERFVVGKVTAKARPIRITNSLTSSSVTMEVCSEETIYQIMMRYMAHNKHLLSYTWLYLGRPLCLNKTLQQNGVLDERKLFNKVALPDNVYIPNILLTYNDDLTEDPFRRDCSFNEFACMTSTVIRCHKHSRNQENPSDTLLD